MLISLKISILKAVRPLELIKINANSSISALFQNKAPIQTDDILQLGAAHAELLAISGRGGFFSLQTDMAFEKRPFI